ncbi:MULTISPECIES: aldo/keto reductase [Calothrix]|uniref:Aldo/keto reductase n=2 Tax=Calothrix TaxID=1186 RepID=A0ABR8AJH9_9CYAN|nr:MULTISPECIES: aldo/keto reductase [Calothrix]MBD2199914.1 aldo/keto reductase [Calothrix parietina FACHB-288]MBD2228829.1 aldo/keto reductase [Calothrix anomala FACHB-343]
MKNSKTRRNFLLTTVAMASGIVGADTLANHTSGTPSAIMPERILGLTGVKVPILGLGGAGTNTPLDKSDKEREAVAIIEKAIALGIRYFDTARSYGASEIHFGKVLPTYRSQIFLTSKTAKRDRDSAWRELESSLKRLNTNYLDLWQLHHVSFHEEIETIFSQSGAIKALEEAIQQKIVRFAGITGHRDTKVIAEGIRRFPFHTTLIPINAVENHHPDSFIQGVLPLAKQQNLGVIAMKVPAYGKLLQAGGLNNIQQALGYTLSQSGVHCCIIPADSVQQLEENVQAAISYQPLNIQQLAEIEQRTHNIWQESTFYRAWS